MNGVNRVFPETLLGIAPKSGVGRGPKQIRAVGPSPKLFASRTRVNALNIVAMLAQDKSLGLCSGVRHEQAEQQQHRIDRSGYRGT